MNGKLKSTKNGYYYDFFISLTMYGSSLFPEILNSTDIVSVNAGDKKKGYIFNDELQRLRDMSVDIATTVRCPVIYCDLIPPEERKESYIKNIS